MADENEETPLEETPLVETPASGGAAENEAAEAAAVAAAAAAGKAPTLAEAMSEAIDNANKPRTIQPKQEELDQQDTRPRNADGTFKTETAEEKTTREAADAAAALANETPEQKAARLAAETPEEKATREAAEAAAKTPDAINDPIPKDLNKRTAARMQALIDTVKEQQSIVESHTQLFDVVREAGSPEEFSAMIGYMKGTKSNDPKVLEQAYALLQGELRGLAVRMGKPLYEVNLLRDAENKDLVDEIAAGTLTNQRAHELALNREAQKQRQGQSRQTDTAAAAEQDRQTGVSDLNALEVELVKRDGVAAYRAKRAILESTLQATMKRVNPKAWREVFTDAYEGLKLAAPAAAPAPAPLVEKTQPQRPKQPAGAGGASTAPKSALEAINQALGG